MKRLTAILWRGLYSWISARNLNGPFPGDFVCSGSDLGVLFQGNARRFLHVGCGSARKPNVGQGFLADDWEEIRLDIDPGAAPDVLSSMLDMEVVPDASVDAVYSSHNIEHLYPHEVPVAFAEFLRVLKPGGVLVLSCPDLQSVCRLVGEGKLTEPAYISPAGPIAPLDILYGLGSALAGGNLFMAHHTGFTLRTLVDGLRSAGFPSIAGRQREANLDLWIVASKAQVSELAMHQLADIHLPR